MMILEDQQHVLHAGKKINLPIIHYTERTIMIIFGEQFDLIGQ